LTGERLDSLWLFAMPAIPAIATLAAHLLLCRFFPSLRIYKALAIAAVVGSVVLCALIFAQDPISLEQKGRVLAAAVIFLCFCYVFFHFNNMGETARRIRLLRELTAAGRPLTFQELVALYGPAEIAERRLSRLVGAGQVGLVDGRYVLADQSVHLMARLVNIAHWLVFGRRRELREVQHD